MSINQLPRAAVTLGLAGVIPQAICVAFALSGGPMQDVAVAAGCGYAGIILSFLGGCWWMAALLARRTDTWIYVVAVSYSLLGWALLLPASIGWHWTSKCLVLQAVLLLASPLVDHALASRVALPVGWHRLRWMMAGGLGSLTLLLAFL